MVFLRSGRKRISVKIIKHSVLYIFLIGMIALSATSCQDDLYKDDGGGTDGTGDNLSMVTRIALPREDTQIRVLEGTEIGTSYAEILIDTIRVVFYNSSDIVEYSIDLQIALNANSPTSFWADGLDVLSCERVGNSIEIKTHARTFKPGNYELLVVVNPNQKIKGITEVGKSKDELDTPFGITDDEDYSLYKKVTSAGQPAFFLMLNDNGLIKITRSDFKPTKEDAEANPVNVNVERVAAKIDCVNEIIKGIRSNLTFPHGRFVIWVDPSNPGDKWDIPDDCLVCPACGTDYNQTSKKCANGHSYSRYDGLGLVSEKVLYAVATDILWQVDIINRESYWLRQFTGETTEEKGYAQDSNYDSLWRASPGNYSNYIAQNFVYINEGDTVHKGGKGRSVRRLAASPTYSTRWSWTDADPFPVYIPENTMDRLEQRGDVTTRVLFKAILRREFGDSSPGEEIGDFFVFHGGLSNSNGRYDNIIDNAGTFFYIIRPEDMARYVAGTSPFPDNLDPNLPGVTRLSEELSKVSGFNFAKWGDEDAAELTPNLAFYKNSTIFYSAPVKHYGTTGYGNFGVVRNHRYTVNIQAIRSIGEPVIPKRGKGALE